MAIRSWIDGDLRLAIRLLQWAQPNEMQKERIGGFTDFINDVKSGKFPQKKHVVTAPDGLIESFLERIREK